MIFQVNLENTLMCISKRIDELFICSILFENLQMKNGLKIDVKWFEMYFQNLILPHRIVCFVRKFKKKHCFHHNF